MGDTTAIAWTDHTQNWWLGCFKVSDGCKNCYADTLADRRKWDVFGHDTSKRRRTSLQLWNRPYRWNREAMMEGRPRRVFSLSMGDFFEDAPQLNEWRKEAWEVIRATPWLDWQLLTKRPENIARMLPDTWDRNPWGCWPNVWLGASIEDDRVADRGPLLTAVPAVVHFVSYEPCLGPLKTLPLDGIEWMIVGGESGPGYRKMDLLWAVDMLVRCEKADVAYFFKQNSGARTETGIDALGQIIRNYPKGWDRKELRR